MAKKLKTYTVSLRIVVETNIEVPAENYEQAISKAREIKVKDVVEFDTDFNDGNIAILGIFNHEEE